MAEAAVLKSTNPNEQIIMSNVALFNPLNAPAFVKRGEMSALAKALAGGGSEIGKRISLKAGFFRLLSEGKEVATIEDRFLDVVIVAAAPKVNRIFFAAKFDSENPKPADCWSIDGEKPSETANAKQAETCNSCPQNIAGSGQGNGRACNYQQRTAVVLANAMDGDVLGLTLAATSLFGKEEGGNFPLQAYARWLAAQKIDPAMVVTRLRFDTKSEFPKLFFKTMRFLTEDEYDMVVPQSTCTDAVTAITLSISKSAPANVAAPIEGVRPTKKAVVQPVQQDEEEEPAPAPVVKPRKVVEPVAVEQEEETAPAPVVKARKVVEPVAVEQEEEITLQPVVRKEVKAKPPVAAKQSDLSQLVSEWDDE